MNKEIAAVQNFGLLLLYWRVLSELAGRNREYANYFLCRLFYSLVLPLPHKPAITIPCSQNNKQPFGIFLQIIHTTIILFLYNNSYNTAGFIYKFTKRSSLT